MAVEKKGTMMSELDYTKAQLGFLYIIILLSLDIFNPVKIFLHVFPAIAPWHVASVAIICMIYTFITNLRELLYFAVKIFFHSVLSIFFNDVQIVGKENIPSYGPVIFTSNHANQFMDGLMIMCTCQRKISYLVAAKSWNRAIIGHLAWAMGAVPVKRAQDSAKKGTGSITIDMASIDESVPDAVVKVTGERTKFLSEMKAGDKIRLPGNALGIKVASISGDNAMTLQVQEGVKEVLSSTSCTDVSFDILPHIDQADVYKHVLEKMASGGTIGIFPEGGSHDRTDLLPLKVGVALIAYSELEKDGINVPIVPVGLNYFRAHRFRGKATVEFGSPTYIDPATLADYKRGGADKRRVCSDLLERIENSMKSVIVSVPDYETMQLIHAARRLYRSDTKNITAEQRQDMGRRFAEGYKRLLIQTSGNPPQEWVDLQNRILEYQEELNELGIRDYQVPGLDHEELEIGSENAISTTDTVLHRMNIVGHIVHLLFLVLLAAPPALLLNLPVGLAARIYSNRRRIVALEQSKVKIKGYDVVLSERVLACIILVPTVWVSYGGLLLLFTSMDWPTLAFCFTCFPLFSYWSIMATESGMVDVKDLRPYVMRMFPSARKRLAKLPATRKTLKHDLRAMVKSIGPTMGDLYYEKQLDWQKIQLETKTMSSQDLEHLSDKKNE